MDDADPRSADERRARFARRADDFARQFAFTGLSLAAVSRSTGPVVHAAGTTADARHAIDAHTPFSVASSGKHATAVAVLALARAGRVALDDPIGRHLDDLPATWRDRRIVDLLHHTSGLPEYLAYRPDEDVPMTRAGFVERYRHLAPVFEPGEAWYYSNTNYILLGFLVAQLVGRPYPDALQDLLFTPGGCVDVAAGGPDLGDVDSDDVYARTADIARSREVAGDGDLVLSAMGALSWERALASDAILDEAGRGAMTAPAPLTTGRTVPYGCGWFLDRIAGRDVHHHAGHFGGWTAFFLRVPSAGAAIYLMTNVAFGNTRAQRYAAQALLETIEPGTTPLSLPPIVDDDAVLTRSTRDVLLRPDGGAPDLDRFASELRLLAERVVGVRSVLNLWCGEEPTGFELVERWHEPTQRYRRYRIAYARRIEHVLVGYALDDRIHWAWPL